MKDLVHLRQIISAKSSHCREINTGSMDALSGIELIAWATRELHPTPVIYIYIYICLYIYILL
jgi:hypothetical protein